MPVEHFRNHPDVHQPFAGWSEDETLHVAACYSNPFRWRTRRELANNFRRHMQGCPNVVLHFIELAHGERPFELTDPDQDRRDVQVRTTSEMFFKEDLQKRAIQTFPVGWKYGATIDADFHFTRHDWALETIHQLQHYDFVQPFSSYVDLSGNVYGQKDVPLRYNSSFFFNYHQNGFKVSPQYHNGVVLADGSRPQPQDDGYDGVMLAGEGTFMRGVGATGGALAFRHSAYDATGGLLNRCILGHADWYMAYGLLDIEAPDINSQAYHPDYKRYVNTWRERARVLKKNVGYVDGHAIHYFHGSKTRRAYSSRDKILAKHSYSPYTDVFEDYQGILQLNPNKPEFRDDIRKYFTSRFEDDPNISGTERLLV